MFTLPFEYLFILIFLFSYSHIFILIFFHSFSSVWSCPTPCDPWIAARLASLSITNAQTLFKLRSTEWVMTSSHLILRRPLLLLPSVFPSIRVYDPVIVKGTKRWHRGMYISFSSFEYYWITDWYSMLYSLCYILLYYGRKLILKIKRILVAISFQTSINMITIYVPL